MLYKSGSRRFLVCLLAIVAGSTVVGGCEDVELNWGVQQQPKPRPAGPPAGRMVAQSEQPTSTAPAASPQKPAVPAAQPSAAAPQPARSAPHIYQLVLLSQAGPAEAPPGMQYVRLQSARARDVANVLMLFYLPYGPSGTEHRYTLVYPTPLEIDLAGDAARVLDVGTATAEPAGPTVGDAWRWGIAEAFVILDDPTVPPERVRQAADALVKGIHSAELPKLTRFIGAMLAGELLAHRVYDYAAAEAVYRQAEATVDPGSYEQMALMYAHARALRQDGRREPARRILETILGQFTSMRGSETFERVRDALAQWDKKR